MENQSVVRIYATTQSPDYESPWQTNAPTSGTGSGVVIAPGRVLTGAHVVADATFLQVQKVSDPNKMVASVLAINHDCDLALLTVDDPRFMEGVVPEELGELPRLRDRVFVVGYPVGGEEISITEGVVSRTEVQRYSHSERMLLATTVDAAINSGNSGGPVFMDDRIAGIAFQTLRDAENVGELVPAPLIRKFLEGVDKGKEARVPGLGISTQSLENPLLRQRAGLGNGEGDGEESGVLVVSVEYGGSSYGAVQAGDALLAIGGYPIANNGTIRYQSRFRTRFDVVLGDHHVGDVVPLTLLRAGERLDVEVTLRPYCALVPRSQYNTQPSYFVYGGLVFQPLSLDLLRTWSHWWEKAPVEFLHHYYVGSRTEERQEVVVLIQVLADEINLGYEDFYNTVIESVNDTPVKSMSHFVRLVESSGARVEIRTSDKCLMVLDTKQVKDRTPDLLARYHVPRDRSADLIV
jgi:S1-C subfamily serine protease